MAKGQKKCKICQVICGCRTLICPNGHSFEIKSSVLHRNIDNKTKPAVRLEKFKQKRKKPNLSPLEDWTSLVPGDIIRVSGGPIWIKANGEAEYIGYEGSYSVLSLDRDCIHATPVRCNDGGHCVIYMGPDKQMKSGSFMKKHIVILTKKANT
jgi:hypothetical protein